MSISCPVFPCGKISDQPGQGISRSRGGLPLVICPHTLNNPLRYTDPSGHFSWPTVLAIAGAALTIAASYVAYDILSVAPITGPRALIPTSNNMTGWLTDRLNENSAAPVTQLLKENFTSGDPIKMAGATKAWIAMVKAGGVWDYKVDINRSDVLSEDKKVVIGGMTLNYQAIANINFGAMGREIGMPSWMLEGGAGAFQVWDNRRNPGNIGPLSTYFDDPHDNWMVRFGEWLYDQYGDKFGKLTPDQLTDALKKYQKDNGSPGDPLSK